MSITSALYGAGSVLVSNLFVKLPLPEWDENLADHIIVVTGANTGLGYEASLHLSRIGVGQLILAVRNMAKGQDAKRRIIGLTKRPQSSIDVWAVDMEDYDSIRAFAKRAQDLPRLDGLLANAGLLTRTFTLSQGYEKNLSVNVISTLLLCFLLLPKLRESGKLTGHPSRLVIPNSALHYLAPMEELDPKSEKTIIDRLNDSKTAKMDGRYALSKLLILYAVRELVERASQANRESCIINTPNPSFCKSGLTKEAQGSRGFRVAEKVLARSTEEGSRSLVHALLADGESNGQYLSNCHVAAPASHVTDEKGQAIQKKVFDELMLAIDAIHPGLSCTI